MSELVRTGRCFCGAIRLTARGAPKFVSNCHCESCRKASSAPMVTWAGFMDTQVEIRGDTLQRHASSPGVQRMFCGRCGSAVGYRARQLPAKRTFRCALSTSRGNSPRPAIIAPRSACPGPSCSGGLSLDRSRRGVFSWPGRAMPVRSAPRGPSGRSFPAGQAPRDIHDSDR